MKLVILDRDGVINRDSPDYIKSPDEWQPYPGSLEAISRLHRNHYRVIVATNQSGISRNLFDLSMLHRIHQKMIAMVNEMGAKLTRFSSVPTDQKTCARAENRSPVYY